MTWLVKAKKNGTVRRDRQTPVIRGLVITFEMIPPDWKRVVIVMITSIKAMVIMMLMMMMMTLTKYKALGENPQGCLKK